MMISRWFERLTMTVILINCVTLGMYKPCADTSHCNRKCLFLTVEGSCSNIVIPLQQSLIVR